jgi:hypothetical protein
LLLGVQEVPGSNPGGPTKPSKHLQAILFRPRRLGVQCGVHFGHWRLCRLKSHGQDSSNATCPRFGLCNQKLAANGQVGRTKALVFFSRRRMVFLLYSLPARCPDMRNDHRRASSDHVGTGRYMLTIRLGPSARALRTSAAIARQQIRRARDATIQSPP